MSSETVVTASGDRFIGRVKWFNNKAGYGFITVTTGPKEGSDIFVHHSGISVVSEQYKYLVQGEYIEFSIDLLKDSSHEFQAVKVSGINGGKLMCETRREFRQTRISYKSDGKEESSEPVKVSRTESMEVPRSVRAPKSRGSGPREGGDWSVVKGGKPGRPRKQPLASKEV
jgi:cold shock CspA family protein